jgi:hypothetical protein
MLKIEKGFFKSKEEMAEEIHPETLEWIDFNFETSVSDTVLLIAKVVSKEGFDSLKDCLISGIKKKDFNEHAELDFSRCKCPKCLKNKVENFEDVKSELLDDSRAAGIKPVDMQVLLKAGVQ